MSPRWKWTLQHRLLRVVSIAHGEQCLNCPEPAAWLFEFIDKTHWWHENQFGFCLECLNGSEELEPHPEPPYDGAGWVYFIRAGDLVKIGYSENPERRLTDLATGSPQPLELWAKTKGGTKQERELHRRFALDRSHGEWFHITDPIREYVGGIA